ncbi:hypothetical protein N7603_03025 [Acholeplasma vituli]|uniref:Uncharacterized protein n=1 Tax=Paracholeplasma vituli TaxID=69473 RepID=A0ABT2PUJ8_9MOLU|nr:hypothetical protein [Paracholeplasma vituli]MBW4258586.1 hypothetical protein [Methanobacterium sp. YSL]MCU0104624.1 hypothetical protein [Paracholeplasma vituli]
MSWGNESRIIGEKVSVVGEKEIGVITRIDADRRLVYVLFKRMREVAYPYPEAFEQNYLILKLNANK